MILGIAQIERYMNDGVSQTKVDYIQGTLNTLKTDNPEEYNTVIASECLPVQHQCQSDIDRRKKYYTGFI